MSVKKSQFEKDVFYFFTITCYQWLPLFEITNFYNYIYNWFDILKSNGIKTVSYVIMPNHIHSIVFFPEKVSSKSCKKDKTDFKNKSINQIIGTGKRFMAYEIVRRLEINQENEILKILRDGVNELEKRRRKIHQVFQTSFDLKSITSEKFLIQKINYIHVNPIAKKWNLVEDFREYKYSSAGFYELENYSGYMVDHYLEV
jgi:REP element-mobilizing transposase RayT